jgi:hypothetical protein
MADIEEEDEEEEDEEEEASVCIQRGLGCCGCICAVLTE